MSLIDRLDHTDPDNSRHIAIHTWSSALHLLAHGMLARQVLVDRFALTVDDQIQLDQLIAHYEALPGDEQNGDKPMFRANLESCLNLLEGNLMDRSEFAAMLGLS